MMKWVFPNTLALVCENGEMGVSLALVCENGEMGVSQALVCENGEMGVSSALVYIVRPISGTALGFPPTERRQVGREVCVGLLRGVKSVVVC